MAEQLEQIRLMENCVPERIQCDNGSEFISKEVDKWAYENGTTLDFSRPGKPTIIYKLNHLMVNFGMNVNL